MFRISMVIGGLVAVGACAPAPPPADQAATSSSQQQQQQPPLQQPQQPQQQQPRPQPPPQQRVNVDEIGGSVVLIGRLGKPLGEKMTVRGQWVPAPQRAKDNSPRFNVTEVDGK